MALFLAFVGKHIADDMATNTKVLAVLAKFTEKINALQRDMNRLKRHSRSRSASSSDDRVGSRSITHTIEFLLNDTPGNRDSH